MVNHTPGRHKPRHKEGWHFSVRSTFLVCTLLILVGCLLLDRHVLRPTLSHGGSSSSRKHHTAAVVQPDRDLKGRELMDAVSSYYPLNRLQCGNWMSAYTKLHRDIMAGRAPQRYTIMRSKMEFENGLADRLSSSVSIFLYALLSGRAFQYDWEGDFPLWDALRSDFIDWRYTGVDVGNDTVLMDHVCDRGIPEYQAFFWEKDLSEVEEGHHTVMWYSDHGGVYKAFDNPHLKDKLAALGLQRETAFACLFDFLYRPVPDIIHLFQPQLAILLNSAALKIGIQIRVGDWQLVDSYLFKPQHYPSLYRHYFECAQEIEDELARAGQPVVWYVLTDMVELRAAFSERYGDKVLVNTEVEVEHIVKSDARSKAGFLTAVGELWTFSLTTSHVITRKSGYGKVPAMVSANGTRHIFTIDYPMNFFDLVGLDNRKVVGLYHRRRCTQQYADDLMQVCTDFTGI